VKAPWTYGDTAHCFLRIDGKVVINGTCHYSISGDMGRHTLWQPSHAAWRLAGASVLAAVLQVPHGGPFYGYFCRSKKCNGEPGDNGSEFINYGRVTLINNGGFTAGCWRNKRFRLCFLEPILACDPELVKALTPKEEDTPPKGQ
jgi:hypothetical protein